MRAVIVEEPGGPEALTVVDREALTPGPNEVVIDVVASAVNRADLLQRQGHYPPPPGASDVLGLECSGRISAVGAEVRRWGPGDEVCALLSGGGYAEQVCAPEGQVMAVPTGVGLVEAAALPEVAATVWSNVYRTAQLQAHESLLVHGGGGGIGTFAIQLAAARGARVFTTAGTEAKRSLARDLGAELAIDYRANDFVEEVRAATEGRGVDVILDNMGASYLARNIKALAVGGRVVVIGLQGGATAEVNLGALMGKRASLHGTTLRARPTDEKGAICAEVEAHVWPLVASGAIRPIVHACYDLSQVAQAHREVEESSSVGKVLLRIA